MKQHFWNVTSRDGWWKSLTTWTIALLASGMTCKITQWVYLCFLTHLSALCCCSLHIGGVEGHLFLFQVCFGMWIQLLKLQHPLFMTINASYHLYMLNMSSFSFMNMHGAITTDVTLAASLKLHGIMIKNYVNVERTVSEISAENNIQAFFFFFSFLSLIPCVICTFQNRMRCIFFNQSFHCFPEKQERKKLPSVWVTMGMW